VTKSNSTYFLYTLILALANMLGVFAVFGARIYGDTPRYLNIIHWFLGEQITEAPIGFMRPLGPLLAVPFQFLGDGAGLVVQNILFYFASVVLMFKVIEILSGNQRQAFMGATFFATASVVIESGFAYLTDGGAWFFYLLSIFITLRFFVKQNKLLVSLNGFLSGLGFLLKENAALGSLFFVLMLFLYKKFTLKQKVTHIFKFGIFFVMPILFVQLLTFHYLNYTLIDWFGQNASAGDDGGIFVVLLQYLGHLFRVLGFLWPLVLIGIWHEIKFGNFNRWIVYFALLPGSFSFLLWTTGAAGRSAFVFAPLGIIIASFGWMTVERYLEKVHAFSKNVAVATLFAGVILLNYWFVYVNQEVNFVNMILEFLRI
jgi:hypothetical protein